MYKLETDAVAEYKLKKNYLQWKSKFELDVAEMRNQKNKKKNHATMRNTQESVQTSFF